MGGVIVADGSARVRDVLIPVYAALDLDWDPASAGSVADEVPGAGLNEVEEAILSEYAQQGELEEAELDADTLTLARRLRAEHLSPQSCSLAQ